jgi:hypothetical protein
VAHVNKQAIVPNPHQLLPASDRGLDKGRIFRDIPWRITPAFGEKLLPKNKSTAMHVTHEHPAMETLLRVPKASAWQFQHERVFQAGEVGLTREKRSGLAAKASRRVPIVVIRMRDNRAPRLGAKTR